MPESDQQQTDALVILVSEETGNISVADQGNLQSGLSADALDSILGQMAGMRRASELAGNDMMRFLGSHAEIKIILCGDFPFF